MEKGSHLMMHFPPQGASQGNQHGQKKPNGPFAKNQNESGGSVHLKNDI